MGNLGNEGSLAAFIAQLRRTHPDASPELLRGGRRRGAARARHTVRAPAHDLSGPSRARPDRASWPGKALGRLWDIPRTLWLVREGRRPRRSGHGDPLRRRLYGPRPGDCPTGSSSRWASCRLRGLARWHWSASGPSRPLTPMTRRLHGQRRQARRLRAPIATLRPVDRRAVEGEAPGRQGPCIPDLASPCWSTVRHRCPARATSRSAS